MKNYEKYAEEIKNYNGVNFCNNFVIPVIRKGCECLSSCEQCRMLQNIWLLEDYEEPEVDWSKIKVDTPILVRDYEDGEWVKRYFAKYKDGKVYAWNGGRTGQTESYMTPWNFAKLAEPEIDWSEVEVDTPILVRDYEGQEWARKYFAKYENETVYAWDSGRTSWSGDSVTEWKYAKLAETEGVE